MILAINPGSTSTKLGLFQAEGGKVTCLKVKKIDHPKEELAPFSGVIDQLEYRRAAIKATLEEAEVAPSQLKAVVGRGGLLRPVPSGTFAVNEAMLEDMTHEIRGSHASNLGALLAHAIAVEAGGLPCYIVDPVAVDEYTPVARLTGCRLLERKSLSHALNTKAVAKRYAAEVGTSYRDLRLVIIHLGSGISVSAHEGGRMVDVYNTQHEGTYGPDRAGGVPAVALLELCYSGQHEKKALKKALFGEGGLVSYLGTKDFIEVMTKIEGGDEYAALVVDGMIYQTAKNAGAMATVLEGRVDAVLVTGGMANVDYVMERLKKRIAFLGPIRVYPGEDELLSLAEGAHRALCGEEDVLDYA